MKGLLRILTFILIFFSFTVSYCYDTQTENDDLKTIKLSYGLPMNITPNLSGNFGELRSNHLHSGIDFKTQKRTGIPVYSIEKGWVSRIRISTWGLGYAIYIDHPDGKTSLYAHLERLASPFDSIAKNLQYKIENFELDTTFSDKNLTVTKGQLIAHSGNSGVSSAPHMHFEIRNTITEDPQDPLIWFSDRIPDSRKPDIRGLSIYAIGNDGILSNNLKKKNINTVYKADGSFAPADTFPCAWGNIGIGIKAFDLMDNNSNIYGIQSLKLFCDDKNIFSFDISSFSFSETRYINAMIDYEAWYRSRSLVMKSWLEPGNNLSVLKADSKRGIVNINEERDYKFRYVLSDRSGNESVSEFTVKGRKMPVPVAATKGTFIDCSVSNIFRDNGFELNIPKGMLYDNLDFIFSRAKSVYKSDLFKLHTPVVPIHGYIKMKIKVDDIRAVEDGRLFVAKINANGRSQNMGGVLSNGWIEASIREFGTYTVKIDTVSPKITPIYIENSVKNRLFRIRITDDASGIKSWRGTIDGHWVMFEYDYKKAQLKYVFDDTRLGKNMDHILTLSVEDACGNVSKFDHKFHY